MQIIRLTKYHFTLGLFLTVLSSALAQSITEDYNNGSINQRESDCWEFENFEINQTNPINSSGTQKKHGATVNMDSYNFFNLSTWASTSSFTTPFFYFDGSGVVTFKHKADDDDYAFVSEADLNVYLISTTGVVTRIFDHTYHQISLFNDNPDGDPDVTQNESVSLNTSGYYRLAWEWSDIGDAATEYFIDDISIDTASTFFTETSTVCLNETVLHTPSTAVTAGNPYDFEYTWSWVGTAGGTISTQTSNDRRASIDWNVGAGTYRLRVQETYENGSCNGRTTYIDVTVLDEPTFAVEMDTVCQGDQATMTFEGLIGDAPFTITYDDESGSQVLVTSGATESILLSKDAASVNIIAVQDANGCNADPSLIKSYPVYYHPKPSTGLIYHF